MSKIKCSVCSFESTKFDEYNSLSLPIPGKAIVDKTSILKFKFKVLYFPASLEKTPFLVEISGHADDNVTGKGLNKCLGS